MGRIATNRPKYDGKTLPELLLPLTEARCEKLAARKPPAEDDVCTWRDGFEIVWTKQGKIRYRYRFQLAKAGTIPCGEWTPDGHAVADALAKHAAFRQQVLAGVDPRGARVKRTPVKRFDPAAPWQPLPTDERVLKDVTVTQILEELWHTCPGNTWKKTTFSCHRAVRPCIEQAFGHRMVRTLERAEVQSLLLRESYDPDVPGKRLWGRLGNVQRLMSIVLAWACDKNVIDVNWARVSLPKSLKKTAADHAADFSRAEARALTLDEAAILYTYLCDPRARLSQAARDGLLVGLLTGLRPIDLTRFPVGAATHYDEGPAWICPGWMFKMGLPWALLPDHEVAKILTRREDAAVEAGKNFLWPSDRAKGFDGRPTGHATLALLGTALEQIQGHPEFPLPILRRGTQKNIERIEPYFLRRGFRSGLSVLSIDKEVKERCMAHQRRIYYDVHDFAAQKRDAWAAYADEIRRRAASVDLDALIEVYKKSDAFKENHKRYRTQLEQTWASLKAKRKAAAQDAT